MEANNPPSGITATQIESVTDFSILQGWEMVRLRPGMYIGDVGVRGLHHVFREIMDNSVDEVLAGHCTEIDVVLGEDFTVTVSDNGRGIPVGVIEGTGKTGVELAFTDIHACRNLHSYPYKVSGGLHGVGASVVNAVSEWLQCEVRQDGKTYRMRFERGRAVTPLEMIGESDADEQGTTVTWLADKTIFYPALTEMGDLAYDGAVIAARCRELAYLSPSARIQFYDWLHGAERQTFKSPGGVADYVRDLNRGRMVFPAEPIAIHGAVGDTLVEVALQYSDADGETVLGFANMIPNPADGKHITGFRRALTRAFNGAGAVRTRHAGETTRRGLTAVVSVTLTDPKFNPSDHTRLDSPEVEGIVFSVVYTGLKEHWVRHPDQQRDVLATRKNP